MNAAAEGLLAVAQASLAGYDASVSYKWREEDKHWRCEDLEWRDREERFMEVERVAMQEERQQRELEEQQRHLDNARVLWARYVEKNRRDVMEKTEQLKAVANMSALIAGFALTSFLQFSIPSGYTNHAVLSLFAVTLSATVGLEMSAVVLCSLLLISITRTGKTYVTEDEEAEFMSAAQRFIVNFRLGDRPPTPQRSFATHWAQRCERRWKRAYHMFQLGIPILFINLALAGWIKFYLMVSAAYVVTIVMALALLFNLYIYVAWSKDLLAKEIQQGDRVAIPPSGLPYDWHLLPISTTRQTFCSPGHNHDGPDPEMNAFLDPGIALPGTHDGGLTHPVPEGMHALGDRTCYHSTGSQSLNSVGQWPRVTELTPSVPWQGGGEGGLALQGADASLHSQLRS